MWGLLKQELPYIVMVVIVAAVLIRMMSNHRD